MVNGQVDVTDPNMPLLDIVLQDFSSDELSWLDKVVSRKFCTRIEHVSEKLNVFLIFDV